MALASKSIRLYLVDGSPKGIIQAEVVNWTGSVFVVPRLKLAEYCKRQEANRTGIYILTASTDNSLENTTAYIGESDNVGQRLQYHSNKEPLTDWEKAFVITSKDLNLTKAHGKYLESRAIDHANLYDRAVITNKTAPKYDLLPEADCADMEYFLQQVQLLLPVLGLSILQPQTAMQAVTPSKSPITTDAVTTAPPLFTLNAKGVTATAEIVESDFVLKAGSQLAKQTNSSFSDSARQLRVKLLERGKIIDTAAAFYTLQEDYAFNSPSGAAKFVLGRSSNGRKEWKVAKTSQTLADWQESQAINIVSGSDSCIKQEEHA